MIVLQRNVCLMFLLLHVKLLRFPVHTLLQCWTSYLRIDSR